MTLFDCFGIFKDKKIKKSAMQIEAIAYKRTKAVDNRIKVAKAAIANKDMKTFCEIMHIDTKLFSEEIDKLPEGERKVLLEDCKQSAIMQQERLNEAQRKEYLKSRHMTEVEINKK